MNRRVAIAFALSVALHALAFLVLKGGGVKGSAMQNSTFSVGVSMDAASSVGVSAKKTNALSAQSVQTGASTQKNTGTDLVQSSGSANADAKTIYLAQLRAWVESQKTYPNASRVRGETGTVEIKFRVLANGNIDSLQLVASSSFVALDRSAMLILKNHSQFTAFPPALSEQEIWVTLPIVYRLQ